MIDVVLRRKILLFVNCFLLRMYLLELCTCMNFCLFLLAAKLSPLPFLFLWHLTSENMCYLSKLGWTGNWWFFSRVELMSQGCVATMRPSRFHGNIPKSSFIRRSGLPLSSLSHCSAFRELGEKRSAVWSRKFQRRLGEFTVGSADCKIRYSSCFLTTPGMWQFSLRPSRRGSTMLIQRPDLWHESKSVCLFVLYI